MKVNLPMPRLVTYMRILTPLEILVKANKNFISVLFLTGLTVAASCVLISKPAHKADVVTVFLTGNELGTMKPCGCSGGQLGGLDRRSAVFNSVPAKRRLVIDTGSFVEGDSEQDIIKFNTIIQAFSLLGYDLVNLTEKDIEIAENLGLLDSIGSLFNIITSLKPTDVNLATKFTKKFSLKSTTMAVTVAAFDVESAPIEQIGRLFTAQPGLQTVNILILNRCGPGIINSITKQAIVDCLVCPAESDEPALLSAPDKKPLVVSVGRFGRYICNLQIKPAKDKPILSFSPIPVIEDLPPDSSLLALYGDYQQRVKEANLLERYPRFPLPDGLEYTGSKSCKPCHEYEYEKWSTKAHAHAYATLKTVGSAFDPECAVCHVVGMKYESGFVSEQTTEDLKDVGCEVCHGPGSEHIRTLGIAKTTRPKLDCTDCHTPETSGEYAGNEELYFEKIIHWREPKAAADVK
ncbi:MAG TPA: cytochrome c family protein [Sedimentisphaerales bacterium]|nr:cytochrome c family protein [Sedimentisphaerales bacterium]